MDDLINNIKKLNVLVIGDIILDKYYFTDVNRISPEAPVPIARFNSENLVLGGAGNVALNLKNFGVNNVAILGIIGPDIDGSKIQKQFKLNEITFYPIFSGENTISKIRIISQGKQLLRLDFEKKPKFTEDKNYLIINQIKSVIENFEIVIVSDYVKGVISKEVLDYLKTTNKFLVADTKSKNISNFNNFNIITPNFNETCDIAKLFQYGEEIENTNSSITAVGSFIKNKLNSNILITRSEMGVSFVSDIVTHANIETSQVYDVTGAGDTCVSIFSLLNYLNLEVNYSLDLMNVAAKITVSKVGNYAPTFDEIKKEFLKEEFNYVLKKDEMLEKIKILKQEKRKIVFTNGCFDILHKGHISYLQDAKKQGDILIVGLNSDNSVKRLKGDTRPIIDEDSRSFILSNLKAVDYVVIFNENTPCDLISILKPDIHVKGGDYKKDDLPETKIVEGYGGEVKILKFIDNHSTSKIVEKIKNGCK